MATITKIPRKSGVRYKVLIRQRGRLLKSKTFKSKTAARVWAQRIEGDRDTVRALGSQGAAVCFSQLADEYMVQWSGKSTQRDSEVAWWVRQLGTLKLIDITADDIRRALEQYAKGDALRGDGVDRKTMRAKTKSTGRKRSAATVNRRKAALSSVLKFAMQQGYLTTNVAHQVTNRSENNKRTRYLSDDERKALLTACRASDWPKLHLLVVLALSTGARLGELLGLRWCDIDFKQRTALLEETKNGDARVLPLPMPAVKALLPFREVGDGLVFQSTKDPDKPFGFRKHWDQALAESGIWIGTGKDKLVFHSLRHSTASYLVANGRTLYEAGEILGHRSIETTKRYAHLSTAHKRKVADEVLGVLLAEEGQ